ncbi:hypothetical protein [Legionella cherrii]|uniref:Mannosyltransferase n=1 Tax=Legionella cherrii TaxID=28084 RepID=A0ABY6T9Z8_9GAMM|nr:hypothetical protein [Legionella cherrii]VEB39488.1 Uncharacterised protein [Legionella cherrii]
MNKDFLRYKSRFITIALLLGYAFLHYTLTRPFIETTFDQLLNFSIPFPYAQRVLVPLLVYPFSLLPIQPGTCFFLAEWLFTSLMYLGIYQLLRFEFNARQAQLLSWLFILLLPLVLVINYRFTVGRAATFFYPADTPAIFFTALGFLWCLRAQWLYFVPLVFLATFNRESSILMVLLIPALHWQKLREVFRPLVFSFFAYITARIIILMSLRGIPGKLIEWNAYNSPNSHFEMNLEWLFADLNLFMFCFCFAGLPLFWFGFYDYIPKTYRPLRYVAAFYFIGLLLVGNFIEPRIFGEIIALLYLPVCIALRNWIADFAPLIDDKKTKNYLYFLNRYAILTLFTLIVIFHVPINQTLLWCLQHFNA